MNYLWLKGLKHEFCEEWLRAQGLFSLKKRLRRDFIAFHNYLKGGCGKMRVGLFQAASDRRRGNGLRLFWEGSSWMFGKIFFTESMVKG